ncbi:MAG: hypothetical protein AABX11_00290 [Nanoarchaeota archaeon]
MNEDLIGGIRNALERGYSLDKIISSFINAGYSPEEVQDAAKVFSSGASNLISHPIPAPNLSTLPQKLTSTPISTPIKEPINLPKQNLILQKPGTLPIRQTPFSPQLSPIMPSPQNSPGMLSAPTPSTPYYQPNSKKSSKGTIFLLVFLLLFLSALLAGLILFKDKIAQILVS